MPSPSEDERRDFVSSLLVKINYLEKLMLMKMDTSTKTEV